MDKVLRIVKKMNKSKFKVYSMFLHYWLRIIYSCDIMPGTSIGDGTRFAHRGLGVVINKNTKIGNDCVIEANVCIGGNGKNVSGVVAPIIGNRVLIGANAVIIGPVSVGDDSKIGAGSVVVKNVESNTVVVGNPAHPVNNN